MWLCESASLALTGGTVESNYADDHTRFQRVVLDPLTWSSTKSDSLEYFITKLNFHTKKITS